MFCFLFDCSGIRHQVEVDAQSMYEAAALVIKAFKDNDCAPGPVSQLEVEIRTSIMHTFTVRKLHDWLGGACKITE